MNKQSRKLLNKAIGSDIATIEVVTTNDIQHLVFDLVSKRQKLYSLVLCLQSVGLVSTTVSRDSTSKTNTLSQYTGLSIKDIIIHGKHVLICTNGIYLHINLNTGKLTDLSNNECSDMYITLKMKSEGF